MGGRGHCYRRRTWAGALPAFGAESFSVPGERARDAPGTPRTWNGSGRGCRHAGDAWERAPVPGIERGSGSLFFERMG